jgi:hypothetical protein
MNMIKKFKDVNETINKLSEVALLKWLCKKAKVREIDYLELKEELTSPKTKTLGRKYRKEILNNIPEKVIFERMYKRINTEYKNLVRMEELRKKIRKSEQKKYLKEKNVEIKRIETARKTYFSKIKNKSLADFY